MYNADDDEVELFQATSVEIVDSRRDSGRVSTSLNESLLFNDDAYLDEYNDSPSFLSGVGTTSKPNEPHQPSVGVLDINNTQPDSRSAHLHNNELPIPATTPSGVPHVSGLSQTDCNQQTVSSTKIYTNTPVPPWGNQLCCNGSGPSSVLHLSLPADEAGLVTTPWRGYRTPHKLRQSKVDNETQWGTNCHTAIISKSADCTQHCKLVDIATPCNHTNTTVSKSNAQGNTRAQPASTRKKRISAGTPPQKRTTNAMHSCSHHYYHPTLALDTATKPDCASTTPPVPLARSLPLHYSDSEEDNKPQHHKPPHAVGLLTATDDRRFPQQQPVCTEELLQHSSQLEIQREMKQTALSTTSVKKDADGTNYPTATGHLEVPPLSSTQRSGVKLLIDGLPPLHYSQLEVPLNSGNSARHVHMEEDQGNERHAECRGDPVQTRGTAAAVLELSLSPTSTCNSGRRKSGKLDTTMLGQVQHHGSAAPSTQPPRVETGDVEAVGVTDSSDDNFEGFLQLESDEEIECGANKDVPISLLEDDRSSPRPTVPSDRVHHFEKGHVDLTNHQLAEGFRAALGDTITKSAMLHPQRTTTASPDSTQNALPIAGITSSIAKQYVATPSHYLPRLDRPIEKHKEQTKHTPCTQGCNPRRHPPTAQQHQQQPPQTDKQDWKKYRMKHSNHSDPGRGIGGLSDRTCSTSDDTVRTGRMPPTTVRTTIMDPSMWPSDDARSISNWGLPELVIKAYQKNGLHQLYPWQAACLQQGGVLDKGENLIYCAPTAGGKTLVAEIIMLRRLTQYRSKKCLCVLPYVSIVEEKVVYLKPLCEAAGLEVRGHAGTKGGKFLYEDVAVCTIEKANGIVNRLVENGCLDDLTVVVIDELHCVGDQGRGYILELLLTKLVYGKVDIQIVGMSATLPNANVLAKWLNDAYFFVTNFRPVPLQEYFKIGSKVYDSNMQELRDMPPARGDPDALLTLCNEVIIDHHSVLVFCATKRHCEVVCAQLAAKLVKPTTPQSVIKGREQLLHQLRQCPAGVDPVLEEGIPCGVAYHHAGLTMEEREVVEKGYRNSWISVLCATTTLAAGVNLPARRVIFRTPKIGIAGLDIIRYKQAAGRAGRAGLDTHGESVLLCPEAESHIALNLMKSQLPLIESCLTPTRRGMTRALLEAVAGGVVSTVYDIQRYIKCTFFAASCSYTEVHTAARMALSFLEEHDFIQWKRTHNVFAATKLGSATFGSSLDPEDALVVFNDISQARNNFILSNELHMIYHLTPVFHGMEPDWKLYYWIYCRLGQSTIAVANEIGVNEGYLLRCQNRAPLRTQTSRADTIHRRFYVALILYDLVHEYSLYDVSQKYNVSRGELQRLQEISGSFSGMVSVFCERLNWWGFDTLITKLQERLVYGVELDILPLVQIPHLKPHRARALYSKGYRTVLSVATAPPDAIELVIGTTVPYQKKSWCSRQHQLWQPNTADYRTARLIVRGAKNLLAQQVQAMQFEADNAMAAVRQPNNCTQATPTRTNQTCQSPTITPKELSASSVNCRLALGSTLQRKAEKTPPLAHIAPKKRKIHCLELPTTADQSTKSCATRNSDWPKTSRVSSKLYAAGRTVHPACADNPPPVPHLSANTTNPKQQLYPLCALSPVTLPKRTQDCERNQPASEVTMCAQNSCELPNNSDNSALPGDIHILVLHDDQDLMMDQFLETWSNCRRFGLHVLVVPLPPHTGEAPTSPMNTQTNPLHTAIKKYAQFGISIAMDDEMDKLSLHHIQLFDQHSRDRVGVATKQAIHSRITLIKQVLESQAATKVSFDMKLQLIYLLDIGITCEGSLEDPRIGDWMLNPTDNKFDISMDALLDKHVVDPAMKVRAHTNIEGSCKHALQSCTIMGLINQLLKHNLLLKPFKDVEMPLVPVLAQMQRNGIGFDPECCTAQIKAVDKQMEWLTQEAHRLSGSSGWSLSTPKDVFMLLFTKLQLPDVHLKKAQPPHPKKRKQRVQTPSCCAAVLHKLTPHSPIPQLILQHRKLAMFKSKYITVLPKCAQFNNSDQQHRIYGDIQQSTSATGRLSVVKPFLQTIPHPYSFDCFGTDISLNMRSAFVARPGCVLLSADYSQIEVRLMAHFSDDQTLGNILRSGGDVFRQIGSKLYDTAESEVTHVQRQHAKKICYGILYGQGKATLAEEMEVTEEEAEEYRKNFRHKYCGISTFLNTSVAECKKLGYVETLYARRRYLPAIYSHNSRERSAAERQAVNTICQGSAADLIKTSMIVIHNKLHDIEVNNKLKGHETLEGVYWVARFVLQIHDELLFEVVDDDHLLHTAQGIIRKSMEGCLSLSVPTPVSIKVGPSWGTLRLYAK